MTNRALLRFSIYYADTSWSKLLSDVISPFLKEQGPLFKSYYLYFSNYRGDHIKLIFEPAKGFKQRLTSVFEADVKMFLQNFPSSSPSMEFIPGKCMWMNYANNSYEINNYDTHFLSDRDSLLKFCQATSSLALHIYINEQLEGVEDVINMATELLLKMFVPFFGSFNQCEFFDSAVKKLKNSLLPIYDKMALVEVLKDAEDAANLNRTVMQSFLNAEVVDTDPEYTHLLGEWLKCSASLLALKQFDQLTDTFFYQIGLSEFSKLYVLNLINVFIRPDL